MTRAKIHDNLDVDLSFEISVMLQDKSDISSDNSDDNKNKCSGATNGWDVMIAAIIMISLTLMIGMLVGGIKINLNLEQPQTESSQFR